jgi:hypothetical protein
MQKNRVTTSSPKVYAKPDSEVCEYCEKFLLVVTKGDKDDSSYQAPEHFESFWNMKKSSKTCGLCWTLIKATEEHLTYSPDVLPQDRNMELRLYELYGAVYPKPFCNRETMGTAGIHEFTLSIGCHLDDPSFRFLVMADGGQGTVPQAKQKSRAYQD